MTSISRRIISLLAVALAPIGASEPADSEPAAVCTLEYQRADNMWAAAGRPDGGLGVESITLQPGQSKVFVTDWKYEKRRNDGTNYYGSHLRIATNRGQAPTRLHVRTAASGGTDTTWLTLAPGVKRSFTVDLMEVSCPKT